MKKQGGDWKNGYKTAETGGHMIEDLGIENMDSKEEVSIKESRLRWLTDISIEMRR